jgi:hypothetical protein
MALYDELSDAHARDSAELPTGRWRDRFIAALQSSLHVLGPHRVTLRALAPVMVGDLEEGVFAANSGREAAADLYRRWLARDSQAQVA